MSVLGVIGVVVLTGAYGPSAITPLAASTHGRVDRPVAVPPAAAPIAVVRRVSVRAQHKARPSVRREAVGRPADFPGPVTQVAEPALAAYQRAATIIDTASTCHLDWSLLAAIGRVESDHGTIDAAGHAHHLTAKGVVRPAIVGTALNGRQGRGTVDDTDAGRVDHNTRFDAPVGPMALLPQTWTQVAVDADADGRRNPQDLDDAALGAAIVVCADGRDLRKPAVLRAELKKYEDARGFVRTVRILAHRYAQQGAAMPSVLPDSGVVIPLQMPAICGCDEHGGVTVRPENSGWQRAAHLSGAQTDAPQGSAGGGKTGSSGSSSGTSNTPPSTPPGTVPDPVAVSDPAPDPIPDPAPAPAPAPAPDPVPAPDPAPKPAPDPVPATSGQCPVDGSSPGDTPNDPTCSAPADSGSAGDPAATDPTPPDPAS